MATPLVSEFQKFDMTQQELHVATTFNHLQKAFLHNIRTEHAVRLINLKPEDGKRDEYFLQKAFLEGAIEAFGFLAMMEPAEAEEIKTTEG